MRLRADAVLCLTALLLAAPAAVRASGPGTTSADFLTIGVGARSAALGGAFTGLADDVETLAYNPAGIGLLDRKEVGLVHDAYASGINHEWLGGVVPFSWGAVGASADMLIVDPFPSYDNYDRPIGQTSAFDAAYQFTGAAALTDSLSVGASGKIISSRLAGWSANTQALDGGVLWRPRSSIALGASLLDLGEGLRFISHTSPLPTALRAGASWTPFSLRDYEDGLTFAVDAIQPRDGAVYVAGGVEYWYAGMLALRAGGRSASDAGPGYTLGVGVDLFRNFHRKPELVFDYAFVDSGDFATTHRVSLTIKFGRRLRGIMRQPLLTRERPLVEPSPSRPRGLSPWWPARRAQPAPVKPGAAPAPEPAISPDYDNWIRP
ncbi:MAG: PorV/PorQ family protein [Elusimicrobia bacterium]|nr:PorV/PorQ family protein [Elusimicrobiota bacterium]